jgi:predicted PhzF superfamily epimerase YddE/YHI9
MRNDGMRLPIYQVDAFASEVFRGNPAAVCPLDRWLATERMQAIAAENNLSETAFFVPGRDGYDLRWFTPTLEVDLCGHATLASAYVVFDRLLPDARTVRFSTRSGMLEVSRDADLLVLDFPTLPAAPCVAPKALIDGLGVRPREVLRAKNYLAVFDSEHEVRALKPDMGLIAGLEPYALIVTAPGADADFVSRFFAPGHGVPEDPVTGSAHCTLVPYWAKRVGKSDLYARQVSARGGELFCADKGSRVAIGGRAVLYLEGAIYV